MAACNPTLDGSKWRPTEIGDFKVSADSKSYVRFGEKTLDGHGGCNRFFGPYELTKEKIEIGPLGSSTMACPVPAMQMEARFLNALEKTRHFTRSRNGLVLADETGFPVMWLSETGDD
jgi:heat shock protein HslJ